ncbi:MAG: ABC transporter substrate-binding protein [Elusimicrobia bacterium]|nr:ABC transporter substrate-binding protein [Elusimicrobiota bacterium]
MARARKGAQGLSWKYTVAITTVLLSPAAWAAGDYNTFTYAMIGDVDSLDPAWEFDGISHEIEYQLYENLIFYKGSSTQDFEPRIASAVPDLKNSLLSKDGLSYTFPIRKNVHFHDGSLLTPEDVKYSLMRFLLMDRSSGPSFLLLEPILGRQNLAGPDGRPDPEAFAEADRALRIEGGALVVRLKEPYAPLLSILAGYGAIVSKAWTVGHGGWDANAESWIKYHDQGKQEAALYDRANGTGPFKLERWDKENKLVVLSRHENYWRKPAALKRLVFRTVSEPGTRKLMLQAGDADAAMMERQFLPQVAGLKGVRILDDLPFLEVHNAFIFSFKINPQANPYIGSGKLDGRGIPDDFFSDIDVRKGFAHAFDYDAYIRDGYRGKGYRARGPIPRGVIGYNSQQGVPRHDLEKAAEHFKKARGGEIWEKGFQFTVVYMEGRADRQLACQILKKNVESLNPKFKMDIRGVQWSTYLSAYAAGKFPMANVRWGMDYPDPHNAVHPFLHSQGYYAKVQGYANPRADALIEKAKSESGLAERKALYYELAAIANAELPQIFTIDTVNFQAVRQWVKGWYYNPIILYGYLYPISKG